MNEFTAMMGSGSQLGLLVLKVPEDGDGERERERERETRKSRLIVISSSGMEHVSWYLMRAIAGSFSLRYCDMIRVSMHLH